MLPQTGDILKQEFTYTAQPSCTYHLTGNRIRGKTDGLGAVGQAVYCILHTERFDHEIYTWNYGVEQKELIGKPIGLVKAKLKKRICQALLQDDRIQNVDSFAFRQNGRCLHAAFTVHTKMGSLEAETEVVL